MIHYVYLLKCDDGTFYTGLTDNLKKRLYEHHIGKNQYTKSRRPVKLICFLGFPDKGKAALFEKYLKSHSGLAFRKRHLV